MKKKSIPILLIINLSNILLGMHNPDNIGNIHSSMSYNRNQRECSVCETEENEFYLTPCGHYYCISCFRQQANLVLSYMDIEKFKCCVCNRQFTESQFSRMGFVSSEYITFMERRRRIENSRVLSKESTRTFNRNYKPCPNCLIGTEKDGGCKHMNCSSCHYHYCWNCLSKWSLGPNHTNSYHSCNRREIINPFLCSICNKEIIESDKCTNLECKHRYHIECISSLRANSPCPNCQVGPFPTVTNNIFTNQRIRENRRTVNGNPNIGRAWEYEEDFFERNTQANRVPNINQNRNTRRSNLRIPHRNEIVRWIESNPAKAQIIFIAAVASIALTFDKIAATTKNQYARLKGYVKRKLS